MDSIKDNNLDLAIESAHPLFKDCFDLIKTTYSGLNLVGHKKFEDFFKVQVLDSILPVFHSDFFARDLESFKQVFDIGTGGGFPLLPLAHLRSETQFTGIDAREKKTNAVREIACELGLLNVSTQFGRIEDVIKTNEPILMTSKAVGPLKRILPWLDGCEIGSRLYLYKGENTWKSEAPALQKLPWRLVEKCVINYPLHFPLVFIGLEKIK